MMNIISLEVGGWWFNPLEDTLKTYFFKNPQIIGKNSQYQSSTNIPVSRFRFDADAVEDQEMFQKEGRHQFWRF